MIFEGEWNHSLNFNCLKIASESVKLYIKLISMMILNIFEYDESDVSNFEANSKHVDLDR